MEVFPMALFVALLAAFVVSHIALASPPLRDGLVARLGENRFRVGYSILSLALLFGAVQAYKGTADTLLWTAGTGAYHASNLIMLVASILFVGSLTPKNRALAGVPARSGNEAPVGVLRWTRHPMMWAFGLWAAVHVWLSGNLPTVILAAGIGTLAVVGAAFQDAKKARQLGADWKLYAARTSFVPFAAILAGKQPPSALWPGMVPLMGGILFWLLMTFLHPSLMKAPVVGIWEFV
ncbi:MAG: NnrU family protein [Sphingomonadaceae bacterium]